MKTKNLMLGTLLLAMGLILHTLVPGIFFGMKPDFLLVMFFLALTQCDGYQEVLALSGIAAILSALTSSIPGGNIANLGDKLITGPLFYIIFKQMKNQTSVVVMFVFGFIGTCVSGLIFLTALAVMKLLPGVIMSFVGVVVLPTALINACLFVFLYKQINTRFKKKEIAS